MIAKDVSALVAKELYRLRRANGLTQPAMADRMGELGWPLTRSGVANVERGHRRSIDLEYFVAAAKAVNSDPAQILTRVGVALCVICDGTPPPGFTCNVCGGTA